MLKRYLLSSAAYRPDDGNGAGATDDEPLDLGDDTPEPEGEHAEPAGEQLADGEQEDGEGADEGDDDGADGAEPARQPSRGNRDIGALRAERRRLAEENAALTRQLNDIRRQVPAPPAETPQQRADRLALLSPEERIREEVTETLARHQQRSDAVTHQLLDQTDRNAYENLALQNPLARKMADAVERELGNIRAAGQNLPRQTVFIHLLGMRAFQQLQKAKPGREQRREQQRTQPANGRGDMPSRRERRETSLQAMERRLGDVPI